MTTLQKVKNVLNLKLPNWAGVISAVVVISLVLALIIVLTFPVQVGNFILDHGPEFLQ
jgi:uncharacterized protein involved in cysteine biosynthesis